MTGKSTHTMDLKNRTRIPAKFRETLVAGGQGLHFVLYSKGCVAVMNDSVLEKRVTSMLDEVDNSDEELLAAKRRLMGSVEDIVEDTQYRLTIPRSVREHIGADKDHANLITVGMGDYIEIWTAEGYAASIADYDCNAAARLLKERKRAEAQFKPQVG